jgi:hypothetical protein
MIQFLKVDKNSRPLAPATVLEALYATITFTLEPGARGSRFPNVMNHLYCGSLSPAQAEAAQPELEEIEAAMRKTPISAVVWTPDDPRRGDDPSQPVNHQASNVFEYFTDVDGRPLLTRLQEGAHESVISRQALRVEAPGDLRKTMLAGLIIITLGVAWMWLGHALFPHVSAVNLYDRHGGGIPVWTFGMYLVMLGVPLLVTAPFPSVRDWFFNRPIMTIGLAIVAVIGWLVICANAGFLPD